MKRGKFRCLTYLILLITGVLWLREPDSPEVWAERAGSCVMENAGGMECLHIHEEVCYDASGNIRCRLPQREEAGQRGDCHVHKPECFASPDIPKPCNAGINGFTRAGILLVLGGLVMLELQQKTGYTQSAL